MIDAMTPAPASKPHLVVLGGGNGTSRLLHALRPLLKAGEIGSLYALVLNADDGGSTGRLRQQYGVAAMGDLTKSLLALSGFHGDVRGDQFLRALDYRFTGGDFAGHTLRNIFLTSLEKTSDIDAAIAMMARILQVPKHAGVIPTTVKPLTQQVHITFNDHAQLLGEGQFSISHNVNLQADPRWQPGAVRVSFAEGDVPLNPRAAEVLAEATHVIVAPGHTYGTILPTLALPALARALAAHPAELTVVMTLLTTPHHTEGWSGEDFVQVYESYISRPITTVIANTGITDIARAPGQEWVRFTAAEHSYQLIEANLVSTESPATQAGDTVPRAVVVHDATIMQQLLRDLITGTS